MVAAFTEAVVTAYHLALPLIIAGILHMLAVRFRWCQSLAIPLHRTLFGSNKTWRGFLLMPIFCSFGFFVTEKIFASAPPILNGQNPLILGLYLGLAYVLGELPNSYLKRRMGIAPGKLPEKNRWFFFLLDHFDSALACCCVYIVCLDIPLATIAITLIIGPLTHVAVNVVLWALSIRREIF